MKLVKATSELKKKWDNELENLPAEAIFMYSYYWDAVAPGWQFLIDDKGKILFPIWTQNFLFWKRAIHPNFSRYIFLNNEQAISFMEENFHFVEIRIADSSTRDKAFQALYIFKYSPNTNVKRMVKKAKSMGYSVKISIDYESVVHKFESETLSKISSLKKADMTKLKNLCEHLQKKGKLKVYAVEKDGEFIGGALYITHKNRIIYLKGAVDNLAKQNGAMYLLMNEAIENSKNEFEIFDFGGSGVESVANFNRKFGATDYFYKVITLNKMPFWYKWWRNKK